MEKTNIIHTDLAERIEQLITEARRRTVATVNTAMVYTYYEIGRMIVEDEQKGKRAEYGTAMLKNVSERLTRKFGKGFSAQNLANMRQFYITYSKGSIFQTLSRKSLENEISATLSRNSSSLLLDSKKTQTPSEELHFTLSWSHYLKLMRIENPEERRFYELEATENNWSLRELQRQFDSSLYERLALSKDKEGVKLLAQKGQIVEKPEQMQMYVNYYDRFVKLEDENPTIGILLCTDKSDAMVEITLPKDNNQIFASKYQTILPSKEELQRLIEENVK